MFRHTQQTQYNCTPDAPDPLFAMKLQEILGGAFGEMTVAMQYLFQGWNTRVPGKYKDLILDTATEELGHVEMICIMIARLLEGAPAEQISASSAARTRSTRSSAAAARCPPTASDTRGTAGTSSPAGTSWRTSTPTPTPRCRAACRCRGSST
jgi:Mn-containing catalase